MSQTPRGKAETWTLALLLLSSLGLHLYRLDWGLPNWRRSLAVFGSKEKIQELSPLLVRLREEVYSQYRDVAVDTMAGQPGSGQAISRDMVYNGMRSQLLQPRSTDEQQVIGALSRLKQAARDKRLPFVVYGYAYLLMVGLSLLAARLCGFLTLTPDIAFYMLRPDQVAWIYIAGRLVGASAVLATVTLLYWTARPRFGWKTAAIAAFLYSWHPICVINGHFIKPWACAALFDCALLHFCLKIADGSQRRRDYLAAGVFSGLAGGTSYLYALNWFWVLLARGFALRWKWSRADLRPLVQSALAGAAVFFATNPHVLFYFGDILRLASRHSLGEPQVGYLFHGALETFFMLPGIFYLPALAFAAFSARRDSNRMERFLWMIFPPSLLLYGLIIGGSAHHLLPLFPVLCLIAARGMTAAFDLVPWKILPAALLAAALAASAGPSVAWLRDAGSDNLERAGAWVTEHLPSGSSIAITHAIPGPSFPPFRFLDYRLKYYRHDAADAILDTDYVVNVYFPTPAFAQSDAFRKSYQLSFSLTRGTYAYANLPAPLPNFAPYAAANVQIWRGVNEP